MREAMNILVLGVSGMLGHILFMHLFSLERYSVHGEVHKALPFRPFFSLVLCRRIFSGVDVVKLVFVMDR